MRKYIIIFLFAVTYNASSQEYFVNLSELNICKLTIEDLKKMDPDLTLVAIEQKDFCRETGSEDGSPEIKFGFKSRLFPGVRFYEPKNEEILITKIHLTKEFKGYLPDGKFVEIKTMYVSNLVNMYNRQVIMTANKCHGYFDMISDEGANFMLKIYKTNEPLDTGKYVIDEQQLAHGIDIVFDCQYASVETRNKTLYVINGKETTEKEFRTLHPDTIVSVTVLKDSNAERKYGAKGKNGVIEVILKK
jgi:hypothetical protein